MAIIELAIRREFTHLHDHTFQPFRAAGFWDKIPFRLMSRPLNLLLARTWFLIQTGEYLAFQKNRYPSIYCLLKYSEQTVYLQFKSLV